MTKIVYRVSTALNQFGTAIILVLILLTTADVILRYFFNQPIKGTYEITRLMMLTIVSLGIGYTQYKKGHIAIDVITMKFSRKSRLIDGIVVHLLCLGIYIVIAWQAVVGGRVQQVRDVVISEVVKVPLFPFYYVLALGCVILCLVYIIDIAEAFKSLRKGSKE